MKYSKVKIKENKRIVIFDNPNKNKFSVTQIDGCLVSNELASDYLVTSQGLSILIELKGRDVTHACDQLIAAALHPKVQPLLAAQLGFLIVCKRYPRFDSYIIKAKQIAVNKYKAGFHVICDRRELDIRRLARISE